ncbi:hypothetical protein HDU87_001509, partial [Geranomyces variabilis]
MTLGSGCIMKPINANYGSNHWDVWSNAVWIDSLIYNTRDMLDFMMGKQRMTNHLDLLSHHP